MISIFFKKKKKFNLEFIVSLIIGFLLLLSLIFEQALDLFPSYIFLTLLVILLLIKVSHVVSKGGTIFEDYGSIFMIALLAFLRFITIDSKINTAIIVVSVIIIFYSIGLIPTVDKIYESQNISSFITSYIIFMLVIIFLFAGTYSIKNSSFTIYGTPTTISFKDSFYFSTMTYTTVGYGDIVPTGLNKTISSIEAIAGIALNIGFIGYILASKRFK